MRRKKKEEAEAELKRKKQENENLAKEGKWKIEDEAVRRNEESVRAAAKAT